MLQLQIFGGDFLVLKKHKNATKISESIFFYFQKIILSFFQEVYVPQNWALQIGSRPTVLDRKI